MATGLCIALVLTVLLRYDRVDPGLTILLWPTSVLGLVDPSTLLGEVTVGFFTFGGNVLLYGTVGVLVRYLWVGG